MRCKASPKAGADLAKVASIHGEISAAFEATFAQREGKRGSPLIPIGHYAGLVDIGRGQALALHTDGVGTKVLVAQEIGKFDTVGIDCIAMTVNDLICLGAEPVSILDYIALEREDAGLVSELAKGLVEGARQASVAIVGGETAIMGDVVKGVKGKGFDLVSMGAGLVGAGKVVDGSKVAEGDVVIAVRSSGLHSNGYTRARSVLSGLPLERRAGSLEGTLGEALLEPTKIYVKPTLHLMNRYEVHGVAHITGGAFRKLRRLLKKRDLMFDLKLSHPDPIFQLIQERGKLSDREMYSTFNMGVGLCLCLWRGDVENALSEFEKEGYEAYVAGRVRKGDGVRVNGLKVA